MSRSDFSFLAEGLRAGDLTDIVIPLVSVDEYASKIDDSAIVIGFYVSDRDGGDDLNRFIQRSAIDLLDSERSPAPDQNGHFMVFVEIMRDTKTTDNILRLVEEVSPLCGIDEWKMQARGTKGVEPLDIKHLEAALEAMRQHDTAQAGKGGIKEEATALLQESDADSFTLTHAPDAALHLTLNGLGRALNFTIVSETYADDLAIDLSPSGSARSALVEQILGSHWDVTAFVNQSLCLRRRSDNRALYVV